MESGGILLMEIIGGNAQSGEAYFGIWSDSFGPRKIWRHIRITVSSDNDWSRGPITLLRISPLLETNRSPFHTFLILMNSTASKISGPSGETGREKLINIFKVYSYLLFKSESDKITGGIRSFETSDLASGIQA